jgi:hypothetical protein
MNFSTLYNYYKDEFEYPLVKTCKQLSSAYKDYHMLVSFFFRVCSALLSR